MPTLGEVLGAIMADVTKARRMADEEAMRTADLYRQEPLLQGMTVPRLRLPDVTIEIPAVVEAHEEGDAGEYQDPAQVSQQATAFLTEAAKDENLVLERELVANFRASLQRELKQLAAREPGTPQMVSRQASANVGELVLLRHARELKPDQTTTIIKRIAPKLRQYIAGIALRKSPRPAAIRVLIETHQVKERSDPRSVTRLRLTLKEEGLEWSEFQNDEGETVTRLTPE
jgi:hypothetical protein